VQCNLRQDTESVNPGVHNSLPQDRILNHMNPAHTVTPYLFKNNFNIILLVSQTISSRTKLCMHLSSLPYVLYTPFVSYFAIWFPYYSLVKGAITYKGTVIRPIISDSLTIRTSVNDEWLLFRRSDGVTLMVGR
jgi:hypothetical protein